MISQVTPQTQTVFRDNARREDDSDARARRIRARILDGIEETLDELAGHDAPRCAPR